jgi:GTP pyrophosphokinase
MRKTKATLLLNTEGYVNLETWLQHLQQQFAVGDASLLRQAYSLVQLIGTENAAPNGQSCLQQGLVMAEILAELNVDAETLCAGLIYSSVQYAGLNLDDVSEQLGPKVAKLVKGAKEMDALHDLHERSEQRGQLHTTIDNLRKMLLAMVDDIRVVLIKLAERLCILRNCQLLSDEEKKREAKETMDIYAPLANRLGIGHLKWELEDLAFRYLNPELYKKISKSLKAKREERELYVKNIIESLKDIVLQLGIKEFDVTGRAKHIYSIYRKMSRKHVDVDEIYDTIAFRVLVPSIEDCYTVLGQMHSLWESIPKEFDDYISQPKPNGYRSIHTAVIGPEQVQFEIQIRTFTMHQESELGVAAHWAYKEGKQAKTDYEAKIALLRQVMDWQKEVTESEDELYSQIFSDRVYVFTPNGDVIDLPTGATPLDFAYHIHSDIGHRCRGAKANGHMVTLTHELQTGERIEILTTKEGHPSRDWLNPHLGYLKTARAKAKVLNWFRKQEYENNRHDGQELFEKELKRLGIKNIALDKLASQLHYRNIDDLFAALGRGDLTLHTLLNAAALREETQKPEAEPVFTKAKISETKPTDVIVEEVGNLLTHMALCCKPIPGDEIIGYITLGQGVSVHRKDCSNILNASEQQQRRLIEVKWGQRTSSKYPVDLIINAYDRPGLVRDISNLLANDDISIINLNCVTNKNDHTAHITLTIEIDSLNPLSRILARINQLPHITEVKRSS